MSSDLNLHKFFTKFPTIHLGDIVLRDLMLTDKQQYLEMMSDPEVIKYMSDEDVPTTLEETEREIKFWGGLFYRKQSIFWAIADASTNVMIGTIGFNMWNFSNRRAEISYDLMRPYWRKGLMNKALNNAMIFGFRNMNLARIEARTMLENEPSRKLLEKVGFKQEGILRRYRMIHGQPTDVTMYSLIEEEFTGRALLAL